jgi:uncharacterized membrane protein
MAESEHDRARIAIADLEHHFNTNRLEAFSDGVFAIAITLLILEIGVPHVAAGESLWSALKEEWPSFFGYGLSFISIGIMWINHHAMWREIERFDHSLLVLNLLLLMCISFVPFPTAVLAENLRNADARTAATLLYGGTFFAIAIVWNALWLYVMSKPHLLDEHVNKAMLWEMTKRNFVGPVLYGVMLPLALISPWISLGTYVALSAMYLLPLHQGVLGATTDAE